MLPAGMVEALREPAFGEEMLLEPTKLLVKQVIGLVD